MCHKDSDMLIEPVTLNRQSFSGIGNNHQNYSLLAIYIDDQKKSYKDLGFKR